MATTAPPLHGLSRDVTLAVLPRLYIEELVTELARRNISFGGHAIKQEFLVGMLKDLMTKEYCNLQPDKYLSDDVTDDTVNRTIELKPDTELAEQQQFQCQELQKYSQTLSSICPSPDIENRMATETTTHCHNEIDTSTKQESYALDDSMSSETYPNVNASLSVNMISASANADCTTFESELEGTETVTSVTTEPILQLDNCSPKTKLEEDEAHSDEIQSNNPGFQRRNSTSSSLRKNSTFPKKSDMTLFSCKDCAYQTKRKQLFVRHTRIHTGEKPYMCPHCDYRTRARENLKSHMLRHSGEKPYNCCHCDFKARQHSQLVVHLRRHTGEKPYLCAECGYRTAQSTDLRRHMEMHTGYKPYACSECGYRTNRNSYLVAHLRIHTGEKPFFCGECDYKSAKKQTLSKHMKKHHNMLL